MSPDFQVGRRCPAGQCAAARAHLFFLPVRDPEKASEGSARSTALKRLLCEVADF